ncbi:hypothetical protein B0O80DRAFT_451762 [Mortierella sp. GBAus27b]|nr:hypothetical protein B0O80DRAFT_451762 [Mortierella sp. GBAus27b]
MNSLASTASSTLVETIAQDPLQASCELKVPGLDSVVGTFQSSGSLTCLSSMLSSESATKALSAGQLVPVRFWTSDMRNIKSLPKKSIKQARHGGGMCQFSLSYDGGKSYHVIATYTKTCPDVAYEWPVRIPDNVPSCNKAGQCLFAWSWTAALVPQFYHK